MTAAAEVIKVLGGSSVLGRVRNKSGLESRLRKGLPFGALEKLMLAAELNRETASRVTGIPLRTFARRKSTDRLTFEESDRVAQFAELFAFAVNVLGGTAEAAKWFRTTSPYLGGVTPLTRLDNTIGRNAVRDELSRIAYGMLA